jgi:diadenosine tetraphosphate (Ap4A) HIT family hydrolase
MPCPLCDVVNAIRRGEQECLAELSESFVILAHDQFYEGYCILVLKEHQEHLARLPVPGQARLWDDVVRVAAALTAELKPARINYENLGNLVAHVHWHVVPRYANDPRAQEPIWVRPADERRGTLSAARRAEIADRMRTALRR